LRASLPRYELPAVLSIEFHIAMPVSWSKKKRVAMAGQYHQQKPDIDNLLKAYMDAFHTDDAHVAIIHAGKYWTDGGGYIVLPD
jgi:Holliday junction resolvase RusA-like endonuclease